MCGANAIKFAIILRNRQRIRINRKNLKFRTSSGLRPHWPFQRFLASCEGENQNRLIFRGCQIYTKMLNLKLGNTKTWQRRVAQEMIGWHHCPILVAFIF